MADVFVSCSALRVSSALCFPAGARVSELVRLLLTDHGFPSEDFYVTSNGQVVSAGAELLQGSAYRLEPRLRGGKGGFGSMLRALGAQIEKTTNREACRDLSGRRLRDVNHEKEMAEWLKKQAELDGQKDQRRLERLQSKLQPPRHQFSDTEYQQQCHELSERLDDSVLKGMQAASAGAVSAEAGPSTKRTNQHPDQVPRKKKRFWRGAGDLDLLDSEEDEDDEDEGPGPSRQTRPSGEPVSPGLAQPRPVSTGPDQPEPVSTGPDQPEPVSTGPDQPGLVSTGPDQPGLVSTGTDQPRPISTSPDQPGPISTSPDQPGPVSTSPDQPEPVSTGPDQPGPVSTSPDQPGPVSTSPDQPGPVSTGPDQPEPVSTGSDQPGPVSTSPDQPGPVSTSPDQPGPVSTSPDQPGPVSTSPDQPGPVSTSPDQPGPVSTSPDQPGPVSTGPDQPGPVSTGPDQPGPVSTTQHAPVDLDSAGSPEDLEVLGLGRLKEALQTRGLKCGGTLKERAVRLYAARGLGPEQLEALQLTKPRRRK